MFTEGELPEGWYLLSKESSLEMENELKRETCKGHVLSGLVCFALARREDRDDFLFSVKGAQHHCIQFILYGQKKIHLIGLLWCHLKASTFSSTIGREYMSNKM